MPVPFPFWWNRTVCVEYFSAASCPPSYPYSIVCSSSIARFCLFSILLQVIGYYCEFLCPFFASFVYYYLLVFAYYYRFLCPLLLALHIICSFLVVLPIIAVSLPVFACYHLLLPVSFPIFSFLYIICLFCRLLSVSLSIFACFEYYLLFF
jgi:hypothetical protein